jgi:hypothetical protein
MQRQEGKSGGVQGLDRRVIMQTPNDHLGLTKPMRNRCCKLGGRTIEWSAIQVGSSGDRLNKDIWPRLNGFQYSIIPAQVTTPHESLLLSQQEVEHELAAVEMRHALPSWAFDIVNEGLHAGIHGISGHMFANIKQTILHAECRV